MSTTMKEKPEKIYPHMIPPYTVGFTRPGAKEGPMVYLNGNLIDTKQIEWAERALKKVRLTAKKHRNQYNLQIMQEMYHDEGWPLQEIEDLAQQYGIKFTPRETI